RIDDSFDHLAPFSSSLFFQFLQPSSNERVEDFLERQIQHLKGVNLQIQKYTDLVTNEVIIWEREDLITLKEYQIMFLKISDVIERLVRELEAL
ncbi:hypothetical protein L195_g041600, partial [Trifolium pratense]